MKHPGEDSSSEDEGGGKRTRREFLGGSIPVVVYQSAVKGE